MPVNNPALAPTIAPKSIQRGVAALGANGTVTIAAVNTAKAELRHAGQTGQAASDASLVQFVLTNSTTITYSRTTNSGAVNATWEVTEWN